MRESILSLQNDQGSEMPSLLEFNSEPEEDTVSRNLCRSIRSYMIRHIFYLTKLLCILTIMECKNVIIASNESTLRKLAHAIYRDL